MHRWRRALVLGAVAGAGLTAAQASPQQTPPTFRTRTTLRAIEVRVVDQRGRPITGLQQRDFTILEDGKPQEIRLFSPIELTARAPDVLDATGLRPAGARPADLTPSTRRIFLIVLGRGNLQIPSKGIDGMIHLVRNLLPQDLVAVQAWNRATDFTSDHEQIVGMLERYRAGHQQVEALLAHHFSGLTAIYGSRDIPEFMEKEITAVLRGPDAPPTRTILPSGVSTANIDEQRRRDIDSLMGTATLDVFGASDRERIGMSLDDYVVNAVQSTQDLTRIYAGLQYLRHFDGDKHLVYVSPTGLALPSADDDRSLARVAQDARVAIDVFHSYGMGAGMWAVASSQNIAELTGGQFTGLTNGAPFAAKIDAATRTGYQLGYNPVNPTLDGKYRKVTIRVNRGGARVLYQHGYYAREDFTRLDRRQVISQSRVEAALRYGEPVPDLTLVATARPGKAANGSRTMAVQVNVAPAGIKVITNGAQRSVSLDVAVFCFDRQYLVGYLWRRVDVRLEDDARYASFLSQGVGFTVTVPIRRSAGMVKAVVYDFAADRIGTVVPQIK